MVVLSDPSSGWMRRWPAAAIASDAMVACAPWGAAGEFAASRHGVLTRSQAADNGISHRVLHRLPRDRDLVEPTPGVLVVVGSPPTWRQQLYVATLASDEAGAAGFRSAATLKGLDGYPTGPVELLLPSKRRIHVPHVAHVGPIAAADITEVDHIRCTSVARTLCDLGSVDPPARVKVAFESAWREGSSLTWLRQTAERLHRPGQRGTGVLFRLLDDAELKGKATESALEVRVERALRVARPGSPTLGPRRRRPVHRPCRLRHPAPQDRHRGAQPPLPLRQRHGEQ